MRKRLREYFIGRYLKDPDVFEQARAIMLLQFSFMFMIIFLLPLITDIVLGYNKAVVLHTLDTLLLASLPFLLKYVKKLDVVINYLFVVSFLSSTCAFMMLNPDRLDAIGLSWSMFFLSLSALLQRGWARILYCFFFAWLPIIYVLLNSHLKGALTFTPIVQAGAEEPPIALAGIPIILCVYAIWSHTHTIQKAKDTITEQKQIIEEKNKDITDSIVYARRIQRSLLPQEKHIEKELNRLKKNKPDN